MGRNGDGDQEVLGDTKPGSADREVLDFNELARLTKFVVYDISDAGKATIAAYGTAIPPELLIVILLKNALNELFTDAQPGTVVSQPTYWYWNKDWVFDRMLLKVFPKSEVFTAWGGAADCKLVLYKLSIGIISFVDKIEYRGQ